MAEGTPAERFAIEHAHYTEDLEWWCALADEVGSPVLDVGAAAGRVSLALARNGHHVVALDSDPQMVAQIEAVTAVDESLAGLISTICADVRDMALDRRFPLIVMPMNTLQAFLAREDQARVVRRIRAHLEPGGVFAFDVVLPDLATMKELVGVELPGAVYREPASKLTLTHRSRFDAVDPVSGNVTFTTLVDERGPATEATTHVREHHVHLFTPSELWELLADAGFEVQAVFGDFAGSPLTPESERQVYRCGVRP